MIELRSVEQLSKAISRAQAGRLFVQKNKPLPAIPRH